MNDKEQLGEIKDRISKLFGYETAKDDAMYYMKKKHINWLIKQAEKAEYYEMKYENTGAIFNRRHMLDKIERYEKAIKECIERMDEGGAGTRSFVYEKLTGVMEGTECMGK